MGLIDCHAHLFPPLLMEAMQEFGARTYFGRGFFADPGFHTLEHHLALMDRFDVDVEVINYASFLWPAANTAGIPVGEAVRRTNDYVNAACKAAPGRFAASAAVDPFGGPEALQELDRAVEHLGLFGISLVTNLGGRALDDPAYEPIFERARAWDMPLWVHPGMVPPAWQQTLGLTNRYLNSGLGFLLDDTLCILKMIVAGVFDRWWGVKFVFCQLGGFVPFMLGRFDQQLFFERRRAEQEGGELSGYLSRRIADYCQSFYVDTHTTDAAAIRAAISAMTPERIVLGGDYPVSPADCGLGYTLPQLDALDLSAEDREKILRGNAARLLNLA